MTDSMRLCEATGCGRKPMSPSAAYCSHHAQALTNRTAEAKAEALAARRAAGMTTASGFPSENY